MMILSDKEFRGVPEYYDWMYLDGYTPEEIWYALHKKLDRELREREEAENAINSLAVNSVVRIKK